MTSQEAASPLVYILPRYDANSPEHVYHLYGFLKKLRERIPLQVVVERLRGAQPEDLPMLALPSRTALVRLLEEFRWFWNLQDAGARTFYVHYSYTAALAASLVVRLRGGAVYYWNCGMYAGFLPPRGAPLGTVIRERLNRWLLEASIRASTYLVTGTPRMADYYALHAHIPKSKIRLMPNFVDIDRFRAITRESARRELGIGQSEKVVLFLHRVAPRKGAHYLPRIARHLLQEVGAIRMIVAGDGPYLQILQERTRQEGVAEAFDFRGWVPNRDVPAYFRAADLFLMPSEEEGFPRVLLESMAAGCPFVAFDVGGVADILASGQADCLAKTGDMQDFSRRAIRALREETIRKEWIRDGERQAQRFTEERVLAAFQGMLEGKTLQWREYLSR